MVNDPHADVKHRFGVAFVQLILGFTLTKFTALHQFDMPVSVQICFQAEGLVFERSESKTYIKTKMLHIH